MPTYYDKVFKAIDSLHHITTDLVATGHFSEPQLAFIERFIFKEETAIQAPAVFEALHSLGIDNPERIAEFVRNPHSYYNLEAQFTPSPALRIGFGNNVLDALPLGSRVSIDSPASESLEVSSYFECKIAVGDEQKRIHEQSPQDFDDNNAKSGDPLLALKPTAAKDVHEITEEGLISVTTKNKDSMIESNTSTTKNNESPMEVDGAKATTNSVEDVVPVNNSFDSQPSGTTSTDQSSGGVPLADCTQTSNPGVTTDLTKKDAPSKPDTLSKDKKEAATVHDEKSNEASPAPDMAAKQEVVKSTPQGISNNVTPPRVDPNSIVRDVFNQNTLPCIDAVRKQPPRNPLASSHWYGFPERLQAQEQVDAVTYRAHLAENLAKPKPKDEEKPTVYKATFIQTVVEDNCTKRTGYRTTVVRELGGASGAPTTSSTTEPALTTNPSGTENVPAPTTTAIPAAPKQEDAMPSTFLALKPATSNAPTMPSTTLAPRAAATNSSSGSPTRGSDKASNTATSIVTIPDRLISKKKPRGGIYAKLIQLGAANQTKGFETLARVGGRKPVEDDDILVPIVLRNETQIKAHSTQKAYPSRSSSGAPYIAVNYSDVLTVFDTRMSSNEEVTHLVTNKRTGERGLVRVKAIDMDQGIALANVWIRGRNARKDARFGFTGAN